MTDPAVTIVEDPDDPRFAQFRLRERGLASRSEKRDDAGAGLFLAEGDLVVGRALDAGCAPTAASSTPPASHGGRTDHAAGAAVYGGGPEVRRIVSGLGLPQSVIALFERPARPSADDLVDRCRRLVVVEGVDNPANVGGIVRNAAGLGWDGLVLDHTSADPLARRALRVAMGTAFSLPACTDDRSRIDGRRAGRHRCRTPRPDPRCASGRPRGRHAGRPVRDPDRFRTGGVVSRAVGPSPLRSGSRWRPASTRSTRPPQRRSPAGRCDDRPRRQPWVIAGDRGRDDRRALLRQIDRPLCPPSS